jgi:HEAT repeat protein
MQCEAAEALADMGQDAEDAIPELTELFKRDQCEVPHYLLASIGRAAVPALIEALEDKDKDKDDKDIRIGAARGLGEIGEDAGDAVPALIEALDQDQEETKDYYRAVAKSLGDIGSGAKAAVPDLIELYEKKEIEAAIWALGSIGKDAVPSLIKLLNHKDDEKVRADAAFALVLVGEDAEAAVNDLRNAIKDENEDEKVRARAAVALVQIDPAQAQSVSTELIAALGQSDDKQDKETQARAALLLGQLGRDALVSKTQIDAVPALIEIVAGDSCSPESCVNAIIALGNIGDSVRDDQIREAIPPLVEILDQQRKPWNIQLRAEAALALGKIGQQADSVVPVLIRSVLIRAIGDNDKAVRVNAHIALGTFGMDVQEDVQELVKELRDDLSDIRVDVRRRAALSLATIGPDAVLDLLTDLDDDSQPVRMGAAAYALGNMEFSSSEIVGEFLFLFSVGLEYEGDLKAGELSLDFRQEFKSHGFTLSDDLTIEPHPEGDKWHIKENDTGRTFIVSREGEALNIYGDEPVKKLRAIVLDENNGLEVRRVAASSLEMLGQDMHSFFEENNVVSPQNAVCPSIYFSPHEAYFEFDALTGKCEYYYWKSGGEGKVRDLITVLCRIFGC